MILVDANVLIDLFEADAVWAEWSIGQLRAQARVHELVIDPIVYAELAANFVAPKDLDTQLAHLRVDLLETPRSALFLAGKAFVQYRRRGGRKNNVLPDFLIGAHAAVRECPVLTRDARRYREYFPTVELITPEP